MKQSSAFYIPAERSTGITNPPVLPPLDALPDTFPAAAERTVHRYCPDDAELILEALGLREYERNRLKVGHKL